MCTCLHTHEHTHKHVHTHKFACEHTTKMRTHMHTHINTHAHTNTHIHKYTQEKDVCRTRQVKGTWKYITGSGLGMYKSRKARQSLFTTSLFILLPKQLERPLHSLVTQATFSREQNGRQSMKQDYSHKRVSDAWHFNLRPSFIWKMTPTWSVFTTILKHGTPYLQLKLL